MPRNTFSAFLGLTLFFLFLGTTYRTQAFTVVQSETVSVSATVGTLPAIDRVGGGGAGPSQSGVKFSGFAYPGATVTIQKGSETVVTVIANDNSAFNSTIAGNTSGLFTLFATDVDGHRSTPRTFPVVLYSGYLTDIGGIRFPPTIITDKIAIKQNEYLTISGAAMPLVPLQISIVGNERTTFTLAADPKGTYSITAPISLPLGEYLVYIRYFGDDKGSKRVRLVVGTSTIYQAEVTINIPGDCNVDQTITIVDFSVLAYWFGKQHAPKCIDVNNDGTVSLVDLSIVAYYWNG